MKMSVEKSLELAAKKPLAGYQTAISEGFCALEWERALRVLCAKGIITRRSYLNRIRVSRAAESIAWKERHGIISWIS